MKFTHIFLFSFVFLRNISEANKCGKYTNHIKDNTYEENASLMKKADFSFNIERTVGEYSKMFTTLDGKNVLLEEYLSLKRNSNQVPAFLADFGAGLGRAASQFAGIKGQLLPSGYGEIGYYSQLERTFLVERDQSFTNFNFPIVVAITGGFGTAIHEKNYHYLPGRLFEEIPIEEIRNLNTHSQGIDLGIDAIGIIPYTLTLTQDLRKIFQLLKVNGKLLLSYPGSKKIEKITRFNNGNLPPVLSSFDLKKHNEYNTFILVKTDGKEVAITFENWLREYQTAFDIKDYESFAILTKKENTTEFMIPELELVDQDLTFAPFARLFRQSD